MRITLVHTGALGDTVLLLPLLRALRAKHAGGTLTLVMRPAFGQLMTMWGEADAWHSFDAAESSRLFAGDAEVAPSWAECDMLISSVSTGDDAWAANIRRLSTARVIHFFNPRPPSDYPLHVTQFHREQLAELDLPEPPQIPPAINPDGPFVIHPGAGGEAKCWPRDRFLELGRALKRNGILPTFILGEAEQERWGHAFVSSLQEEFGWYLHMGLFELSEKMRRARLYLGNDSGVTHFVAALGVPTIALFGPTSDRQWGPLGPRVTVHRPAAPPHTDLSVMPVDEVLHLVLAELPGW